MTLSEDTKRRLTYLVITVFVIGLGLGSRRFGEHLPRFITDYAGDTLWALMVFLGISVLGPRWGVLWRGGTALTFAYAVEFGQLYQAPWIVGLRDTTPGRLVLGSGFLGSDLVCYAVGIALGMLFDRWLTARALIPVTSDRREDADA
jgi:hypothetical protein